MANLFVQLCFMVFLASTVVPSGCSHRRQSPKHVALFVFGDSLFDPGNNNYINTTTDYLANFWPYGETFFKHPTGRFSDGRLINDFIAEFAKLPMIPPYFERTNDHQLSYGVNFASGGAGALVETHAGMVIDLHMQLSYFKNVEKHLKRKLGKEETRQLLSKAVYLFSVGGNDCLIPFLTESSIIFDFYTPEEYVEVVIGNLTTVIKALYKKGGRKFGFVNVGPLGCLPNIRARKAVDDGRCVEELTAFVKLYNGAFSKKLKQLEKQLEGFRYSNFDFFTAAGNMIDNPSKYGFKEAKSGCCGTGPYRGIYSCGGKRGVKEYELCENPGEYLFFDSYHPSERATKLLAEQMGHGVPNNNITEPSNLKPFFELETKSGTV